MVRVMLSSTSSAPPSRSRTASGTKSARLSPGLVALTAAESEVMLPTTATPGAMGGRGGGTSGGDERGARGAVTGEGGA
eukprot:4097345-Prymnesium_polylepis.1